MRVGNHTLGARLRVVLKKNVAFGPGKADILEGIRDTGSIAAAGRRLHMSYKRAWTLVEDMNRDFRAPLVETSKGGSGHGGATLTALGDEVLDRYRRMEAHAEDAVSRDLKALRKLLTDLGSDISK